MKIKEFLHNKMLAPWLLQIGLATMFIYAAIASFVDPSEWVGYLPGFITTVFDAELLLKIFSLAELGLAAWLLSGVGTRYAALLAALMLLGITISNFELFVISFRDIGLAFAALALAALSNGGDDGA